MERWEGRVALVTGASSGIGAAIAEHLVRAGMVVVGAARNVDRIESLSKKLEGQRGTLFGIKCDLTKDEDVYNLFSVIKQKYKGVDVCINNAGMSHIHSLLDGTPKEWREMMDLNVIALCLCTKLAVKSMRERGVDDGHVIHVSSIAAHTVFPNASILNFYSSTKHAVRALTEGLRHELREINTNIRISSISPGVVDTEIRERMFGKERAEKMMQGNPSIKAQDVADSVGHILAAPPHVQIHDLIIKAAGETV